MDTTASDGNLAELLQHSVWVRRLAGSLVRDDALADDLTQEAFVAALRHPPDPGLPLRPWFSQVLRNLVRMRFRGDKRRRVREEVTSSDAKQSAEALDSPERLVERVETQRTLASLVVKLEEPFRTTILLRYYEGLSAADIAARQSVPAGTVRWRVKTGLEKLRTELDRSHGGDRQAWLSAVAPLSIQGLGGGEHGASSVVSSTAKLQGASIMKALIPLAILFSASVTGVMVATRTPSTPQAAPPIVATHAPAATEAPRLAPAASTRLDKQQRAELLQRLTQAQQAASAVAARRTDSAPVSTPVLDADYIRNQMRTLIPLIKECYENALIDKPALAGKLMVKFTIVAEPDIGGLVADSAIDPAESTIADENMRECVQETMYGARFPAPKDGGEVKVNYPFIFKTDDAP